MNHENYFDKAIRKPLNELLVELSTNNLDTLASRTKENIPQIVERIINSNYFQVLTRDRVMSYDCHARFKYEIKGGEQRNFWSPLPLSLAPVPNENYFYCNLNSLFPFFFIMSSLGSKPSEAITLVWPSS